MSKEQFEQELRRKLKGYQPEVDTQMLWQNIKNQQPKNYWGLVSLFMVAMSLGLGFAFWNISEQTNLQTNQENNLIDDSNLYTNHSTNKTDNTSNPEVNKGNFNADATQSVSLNLSEKEEASNVHNYPTQKVNHTSTSIIKKQSISTQTNDAVALQQKHSIGKSTSLPIQNNSAPSSSEEILILVDAPIAKLEIEETVTNDILNQNEHFDETTHKEADFNSNQEFDASFAANGIESISDNSNHIIPNQESVFKQELSNTNLYNQQEVATNQLDVAPLSEEVIQSLVNKRDDDFKGNSIKRKPTSNTQKIKFKTGPSTFELTTEAVIGPMFPIRSLSAKGDENDSYLAEREASEAVLRGYSAEINTYGGFKKHGYFKIGVDYAGFSEAFNFSSIETQSFWDPNGLVGTEISTEGDTIYIYDSVWVTKDVLNKTSERNSFQMLDLTTAMGFTYGSSKWSIFADAGFSYNLLFKKKGTYLNEDIEPTSFSEPLSNGSAPFKKNLGVAVVANLGFAYEIRPNLNFKIQTGYKRYFNDFSSAANPIRQKYNFLDLGMGIQYTFDNF
jgi:hypothetical protein